MANKLNLRARLRISMFFLAIGLVSTAQAQPKNMIFFIGDGMGLEQVKAAGMYANGQAGTLSFELFPYNGQLTTYAADSTVPDSAAAGTALATGVKVNVGVVSMAYPGNGSELETLLEYSKAQGKSTGLVTTSSWFDATPACFGAHEPIRTKYVEIFWDYLLQTRPNVVLGGYHDNDVAAESTSAGYTVVTSRAAMQALDTETETMVFGQFGNGNLPYEYDGLGSLPHLSEMTATALGILDNDPDGFFLMVEGGRIDHACHSNDIQRAVLETVEFDNTVQVAIKWAAGRSDTLILVCADHETGGLTVIEGNGDGVLPTVNWDSIGHTAANVPVYAQGVNAEMISGVMNNTEIFGVVTAILASNPNPSNGAEDVPRDVSLSWTPLPFAATHDVYLGISFADVNQASRTNPLGVLASFNQDANSYDPPGLLDFGQTYFWRVDEVNETPDFTVHKGKVWQFTVEPFAYPIAGGNITATASSQFKANTGPENTINGSGLDDNDLHSNEEAAIWVSSMTGPKPTWIQYEFDQVYKLHQMWVWNYNTSIEPVIGFGIKDVTIEYSVDGTNWATLGTTHEFARAPGQNGYAHNTIVDFGGAPAKYLKITANSNFGGVLPQYGLSEVRFFYIPLRESAFFSGLIDDVRILRLALRTGSTTGR